ncbi:MAG: xylulokinase [Armatimonadetes bacterium]|nr:xylulokinase [Armatimonadota bacterium]
MAYLIGLDIGTSGVKGVLLGEDGTVSASSVREYPLATPQPGWAEQNPEDWWRGTVEVLRELTAAAKGETVAGLGLIGQMHGATFLDERGEVIRPAILWCDQRTEAECAEITSAVGSDNLQRITANPALTGFQAPKIVWLRNHEPGNYDRVAHVLLPKDYVRYRLTGAMYSDVSDASGTTLFDVPNRKWSSEVLSALKIPAGWLPPAEEGTARTGTVSPECEELTGLKTGTPVAAGGGDQAAGAVGAGIVREGVVSSTVGTSGVVFAYANEPWVDPEGRIHTFCHAVPGAWHVMGVMLSAGGSLRWFRDTFGYQGYDEINREAASVPAGSDGLVFLPYLSGERTPHKDPNARGVFFGLSLSHTRAHMARAVMEGVAYSLNDAFRIFRELNVPLQEVRALGGGARSPVWLQIQADVTGLPHHRLNVDEGPAYGAAILAGVMAGTFQSVPEATDRFIRRTDSVEPNPARADRYAEAVSLYRSLYRSLAREFPKTHRLIDTNKG